VKAALHGASVVSAGMTKTGFLSDPASRPSASWAGRLAWLKSQGVDDDDERVVECRNALAYWRLHKAVDAETGQLSATGIDRLVSELRAVTA
jgi:hypothetical protein